MDNRAAWETVLEDLELRVDAAARSITGVTDGGRAGSVAGIVVSAASTSGSAGSIALAAAGSTAVSTSSTNDISTSSTNDTWTPPAGLGTIPAELAERVRDLVHNQQKLIGELETARNLTAKHLAAVRAVPPKRDARASVYLDVAG